MNDQTTTEQPALAFTVETIRERLVCAANEAPIGHTQIDMRKRLGFTAGMVMADVTIHPVVGLPDLWTFTTKSGSAGATTISPYHAAFYAGVVTVLAPGILRASTREELGKVLRELPPEVKQQLRDIAAAIAPDDDDE